MMKLELNGIDVECIIGERPDERTRMQRLRVDVALELDGRAGDTDELADTVDYAALTESLRAVLVAAKCKMIERAAKLVCEACLKDERVSHVEVRVTKAGAIAHLESASVFFTLSRGE